jgi:hypothetical protein
MDTPISAVCQSTQGLNVIFVHSAVDEIGLSAQEFRVYGHLARRASSGNGSWAGVESMAEICRLNKDTVRACLQELLQRRMIRVVKRPGKTNSYYLTPMEEWGVDPSETRVNPGLDPSETRVTTPLKRGSPPLGNEGHEGNPLKVIQEGNPKARKRAVDDSAVKALIAEATTDPECREIWETWVGDRRSRRKPITQEAGRLQIAMLAKHGKKIWVSAVKASIMNGWQGIFIKEEALPSNPEGSNRREHLSSRIL